MEGMTEKSTLQEKLNWALLAGLVLLAVMLCQFPSLNTEIGDLVLATDIDGMRAGYEYAQTNGTAHWWYSSWINHTTDNYFRPLASYFHYGQFLLLDTYGLLPVTLLSMLLHAVLSVLIGVLAFTLSHRAAVAYLAAVLSGAFRVIFGGKWIGSTWLAYFPHVDNITAMIFQVGALCCFVAFLNGTNRRRTWMLAGAWILFLASGLCKEQGWITPLLCMAMAFALPISQQARRIGIAHTALMSAAAILMLRYVRHVTDAPHLNVPLHNFWMYNLATGNWWVVGIGASTLVAGLMAYRCRARLCTAPAYMGVFCLWGIAVFACMSAAPANELPRGQYALGFLVDHVGTMLYSTLALGVWAVIARLFHLYRTPVTALLLCVMAAILPTMMLNADITQARLVFLLPFMAPLAAYVLVFRRQPQPVSPEPTPMMPMYVQQKGARIQQLTNPLRQLKQKAEELRNQAE